MLNVSSGGDGYPGNWAHICDACCEVACTLYCHTNSAYLCTSCDERIHAATPLASCHERVWICTACENAPAAFTCKADTASLCTDCDAEILSANPLAHRHHQVPVPLISAPLHGSSAKYLDEPIACEANEEIDEDETDSWWLLDPDNNDNPGNGFSYSGDFDKYLEPLEHTSCIEYQHQNQYNHDQPYSVNQGENGSDRVVPVQSMEVNDQQQQQQQNIFVSLEFEASKAGFICTPSSSHTVPILFKDNGIEPKATMINISNSYTRPPKGTIELFSSPPLLVPLQFTPMNREAKLLRYREKKKARKFEKKIRYAARKAYAETRPRVKGRFARRTELEVEVNPMFSIEENKHGIIPSF